MTRKDDLIELEQYQSNLAEIDQRLAHCRLKIAELNVRVASLLQERIPYSAAIAQIMARMDAKTEAHFRETQNYETVN